MGTEKEGEEFGLAQHADTDNFIYFIFIAGSDEAGGDGEMDDRGGGVGEGVYLIAELEGETGEGEKCCEWLGG